MDWNEKLVELRGDKTIGEVSDDMMFSPNTYEAFERGDRMPPDRAKEIIAKYFNVEVSDIWK